MTLHMHSVVQLYIDALATPAQKARFYPEVVEQGKLFGSWGSEPDRRGGASVGGTTIARRNGGYVIDGEKHFCTMAGAAFRYMVHCAMHGVPSPQNLQLALVPHGHPGLRVTGAWDTLGMRATVSPSVPSSASPANRSRAESAWRSGWGTRRSTSGRRSGRSTSRSTSARPTASSRTPPLARWTRSSSHHVAEMSMALDGARLVLYQSACRWETSDAVQRAVLAARAKYLATDAALMITSKAVQIVGGRSAHRRYPLERLFRDVRTATLMPPNVDRSMELIGKAALGVGDEAILARHAG